MATGCSNGEPSELKGWYLEFLKIPILYKDVFMYIYLYIDVAMCLMALVEILRITLLIIEKCKRH